MPRGIDWNRVTTLFLDAGNTLISIDYGWICDELRRMGVVCSLEVLQRAEAAARPAVSVKVRDGQREPGVDWRAVYIAAVLECLPTGVMEDTDRILGIAEALVPILFVDGNSMRLWSQVMPGTRPALVQFQAMGLPLHVISNSDGTVEEGLRRNNLRDFFGVVVDSHVVQVEKPDARIFAAALEMTHCHPSEALYVGDLYDIDVVGAESAGMQAVLLDPHSDWNGVQCERVPDLAALAGKFRKARIGSAAVDTEQETGESLVG